jgi:hypothetical protein
MNVKTEALVNGTIAFWMYCRIVILSAGNMVNFGVKIVIQYGKDVDMEIASVGQVGIAAARVDINSTYFVMNIIQLIVRMSHKGKRVTDYNSLCS